MVTCDLKPGLLLKTVTVVPQEAHGAGKDGRRVQPWQYVAGVSFICLAVAVSALMLYRHPAPDPVFGLLYGFGPMVRSLLVEHRYGMPDVSGQYWAYAARLPFVPLFISGLTLLVRTYSGVFLAKNAIFGLLLWFAAFRLSLSPLKTLLLAATVYLLPFHARLATAIDVEEGYLFFFVLSLSAILFTRCRSGYIAASLLIQAIYLTKSSMVAFCLVAACMVAVQDLAGKSLRLRSLLPLMALAVAAVGWGAFVYETTAVFGAGVNASSWNGWNFYKGNNAAAVRDYPRTNLDQLDLHGSLEPPPVVRVKNEWDRDRWQLAAGRKFIHEHPRDILRMDGKKLAVLLYDVGETPNSMLPTHLVAITLLFDHLVFALALALAWRQRDMASLLFIIMVASYVAPYFTSFLYQRHIFPVYGMCFCFVLYRWQIMSGGSPDNRRIEFSAETYIHQLTTAG